MARRSVLVLVAGTGLAAVLAIGMTARSGEPHAPPPLPRPEAPATLGSRLTYPAGQAPSLALPGGRTERVHSVLNITRRLKYGDAVWDDNGIPAGSVWIRVDLQHQLLSVFRAGHEIGTAVIVYGIRDKESPEGLFPVLQKAATYHSITYDAPMPYMLRLTADGVAIHGAEVRRGAATHGCIGIPTTFARKLFDEVELGDPVVIVKAAKNI